jgi:hypothetical protein
VGNDGTTLKVNYERFVHLQSPTHLDIDVDLKKAEGGKIRIWVANQFLDRVRLDGVNPEWESVQVGSDRVIFSFNVSDHVGTATIRFDLTPERIGSQEINIGVPGEPKLSFHQIIFP